MFVCKSQINPPNNTDLKRSQKFGTANLTVVHICLFAGIEALKNPRGTQSVQISWLKSVLPIIFGWILGKTHRQICLGKCKNIERLDYASHCSHIIYVHAFLPRILICFVFLLSLHCCTASCNVHWRYSAMPSNTYQALPKIECE